MQKLHILALIALDPLILLTTKKSSSKTKLLLYVKLVECPFKGFTLQPLKQVSFVLFIFNQRYVCHLDVIVHRIHGYKLLLDLYNNSKKHILL